MAKFLKGVGTITCILILSILFTPMYTRAEEAVILEIGSAEGKIGDQIAIPINIKNSSRVATLDLTVIYDPEELSFISAKAGQAVVDGNICSINPVEEKAYIRFVFSSLKEIPEDGNVMNLSFNVLRDNSAKHTVDMDVLGVYDMDIKKLSWQVEGGREIAPMEGAAEEWKSSNTYVQDDRTDDSEKKDENQADNNIDKQSEASENMAEKGDGNQRRFFVKTEDGVKDVTETAGEETGDNLAAESAENSEEDHSILPQFISVLIIAVVLLSIIIGRRVYKKRLEKDKAGE